MGIFDNYVPPKIEPKKCDNTIMRCDGNFREVFQTIVGETEESYYYIESRLNVLLIIGYLGILLNGALIIFSLSSWEAKDFLYILGIVLSSMAIGLYYILQDNLEEAKKQMLKTFKRKEEDLAENRARCERRYLILQSDFQKKEKLLEEERIGYERKHRDLQSDFQKKEEELKAEYNHKYVALEEERVGYERRYECQKEELNKLLKETHPFCKVAELYKDAYLHVFGDTQPSHINIYQYKLMEYRIKVLQQVFPEIEKYIVEEDELETITAYLNDNRCNARYWLSDEEYEQCKNDEVRMEQLALDRYFSSNKRTKWEIGRDYEMFYGNYLYSKGYEVKYNGIEKGLLDKGIDLIACDEKVIWIIQCKNWGHFGTIYSKTVMQLYGAKEWYKKTHPDDGREIKAELVTSSNITDEAKEIAELLDVKCKPYMDIKRFPSIKLNVNSRGEKIYHLPFDRDYDRTEIKNKEEGYAVTIEEAKRRGFRRAYKPTLSNTD